MLMEMDARLKGGFFLWLGMCLGNGMCLGLRSTPRIDLGFDTKIDGEPHARTHGHQPHARQKQKQCERIG